MKMLSSVIKLPQLFIFKTLKINMFDMQLQFQLYQVKINLKAVKNVQLIKHKF